MSTIGRVEGETRCQVNRRKVNDSPLKTILLINGDKAEKTVEQGLQKSFTCRRTTKRGKSQWGEGPIIDRHLVKRASCTGGGSPKSYLEKTMNRKKHRNRHSTIIKKVFREEKDKRQEHSHGKRN